MEIIVDEHRAIRQALESLTVAIEKLENGEKISPDFFRTWFDFYRTFVLNFHHFKEEQIMFRHLAGKKNGSLDGQMESLRHQHERERNFITEAESPLPGYEKGEAIQTTTLLENIASYASLLHRHIHCEEHAVYPLVAKEFSEAEHAEILEKFKKEAGIAGKEIYSQSRKSVKDLGGLLVN